MKILTS